MKVKRVSAYQVEHTIYWKPFGIYLHAKQFGLIVDGDLFTDKAIFLN